MREFIQKFWNDQAVFLATLAALGTAAVAASATYDASNSVPLAVGAGLGALGVGGTTTHSVGSVIRKQAN